MDFEHLTASLQHHLSCVCKVKKYGTLLYRTNRDVLYALTCALYRSFEKKTSDDNTNLNIDGILPTQRVMLNLNSCIHKQVRKFLADDAAMPFQFDKLDIDTMISNIDLKLWSAIC